MIQNVIRDATVVDADFIVDCIREAFDSQLLEFFPYGCSGIGRYVAENIRAASKGVDTRYWVASSEDTNQCGTIELRLFPDKLFLNYIAVSRAARGQRLGTSLLAEAIRRVRLPTHSRMELDVLEHNSAARGWYDRLEFTAGQTTAWSTFDLPVVDTEVSPAFASGGALCATTYAQLGFGSFRAVTPRGVFEVGMLGERWFRLTSGAALAQDVFALLRRVDSGRRVLVLLPDGELPESVRSQGTRVARTLRLGIDLQRLVDNLEGDR